MSEPTRLRRQEVVDALRRGTVPRRGLDLFAVGMEGFAPTFAEELGAVAAGRGGFKAIRGDFGCGKSFTARWFQQTAQAAGFATAEVQISENDTPLHRLETVYRRALEGLRTSQHQDGAFRALIESWFYSLEDEVIAAGTPTDDVEGFTKAVGKLLEARLADVSASQPQFAAALRACHAARVNEDAATVEGLVAWLMGQPNVAASVKRKAGIKGDLDNTGALAFLRGLLVVLRQTGRKGLVLVLDELETIQRTISTSRDKSLNALRQLIDLIDDERFPGLYLLVTGTPAFFDGPLGVQRLTPLAQRLHVDFAKDARWDNPRAVQLRLAPFDEQKLVEVGCRIRDLYPTEHGDRIAAKVGDDTIYALSQQVTGKLGGKVGVAPRIFLKKLVSEVLDRVDQFEDFDPSEHYELQLGTTELNPEERNAAGLKTSADDIELELGEPPGGGELP